MRQFISVVCLCLCSCLWTLPNRASAGQDPQAVKQAIDEFMQQQTRGLAGNNTLSYRIGAITRTDRLNACPSLRVALPQGGRLWGKSHVVVRCEEVQAWSLYVPVTVKVSGSYLVSRRPLRQGQIVSADDLATQSGDLTELPNGILTDPQQAIGRNVTASIAAGMPLRGDLLRQAIVIRQGQAVKVVSRGNGFEVANEGEALNSASPGQVVRVRLGSGQLVSGIADNSGGVTVSY